MHSHRINAITLALILAFPSASVFAEEPAKKNAAETLPEVSVKAEKNNKKKDRFITQEESASVAKSPVSVQDSPQSITVVDVEQMREMGALNIQEALTYSSGVYAGAFGFDTRGDSVSVRGLDPSMFVDGLRNLYGSYNNTRPDIYTLERIEVLKGPSSVLYGQSDLGGIVNAVTKKPKKEASKEINLQYGMYDRKQIGLDFTGPITADGEWLYRVVALKRDSGTQVDHVSDDAVIFMPSVTWQPSDKTSITMQYLHQEVESQVSAQFLPAQGTLLPGPQGRVSSSTFVGEPGWDRYNTKKDEVALFVDQGLTEHLKLVANLKQSWSSSVTREHWARIGVPPDAAGNVQRSIHTADRSTEVFASDIRLQGDFVLGPTKHLVSLGMDYQDALWKEGNYTFATSAFGINLYNPIYGQVDYAALSNADRDDNKIVQTGFYLSEHMEWGPWIVSAALRRDHAKNSVLKADGSPDTDVRNSATTGRIGLMYRFDNGISPYINYSEAFVPNLGTDGSATNSYLKPTEGEQREAGIKYLANSGNTAINFAWFEIEQLNRVVQGNTPRGVQQIGAFIQGWEIDARQRIGDWELLGNYTRMNANDEASKTRLPYVAEKLGSAWVQYYITPNIRAGVGTRYLGTNVGFGGSPELPSVTLFDAMVGYNIQQWDIRLTVRNIADKEFLSWCRSAGTDCGFGERQNAVLSANYKF
ncbi:TonB-dependent siderophore receptor [Methylophilus sp. Leaf408]|uniref:TonB-dependent siderophore receptor n=1 Tax=Methylophilus sp. Leaf408 TaxID=2876561 RepID=UPI001E657604|nr:TonB-dependent siderophore receptor [Methylophilus sp. Leaf408]